MPGPIYPSLAVFYHCWLPGPMAFEIVCAQLAALQQSGLAAAASEIHIGVNGTDEDALVVGAMAPEKAQVRTHPGRSELSTIRGLIEWLPGKAGWKVCYHHSKGVSHRSDVYRAWRQEMEDAVIWNWRTCVEALDQGYDTAGTRWSEPIPGPPYPPGQRYWQGNFWWATAEYLHTLGPLVEPQYDHRSDYENRYEAEVWIGKSSRDPRVKNL